MIYKQVFYRGLQLAYQRTTDGAYAIAAAGVIHGSRVRFAVTAPTERRAENQLRTALKNARSAARPAAGSAPGGDPGGTRTRGRRRASAPDREGGLSGFDLAVHARDLALLGIDADQPVTEERVKAARRRAAAEHHPDAGGSAERMVDINNAHDALVAAMRRMAARRGA